MGLTTWDPRHDLPARSDDRCDSRGGEWVPRADVVEVSDRYEITLEVPGLDAAAVQVTVKGDRVTLAGCRPTPARADLQYHRMERGQGSFSRTFVFSGPIDGARITATASQGVLTVTVPRGAIAGNRRIEIT